MPITRVEIENLRGIRSGVVDGLSPLSILVGPNNSGKSTVLEALLIPGSVSEGYLAQLVRVLLRRGGPPVHAVASIFHGSSNMAMARVTGPDGRQAETNLEDVRPRPIDEVQRALEGGLNEPLRVIRAVHTVGDVAPLIITTAIDVGGRTIADFLLQGRLREDWLHTRLVDVEAVRASGALEDAYTALERTRRLPRVIAALKRSMPTLTDLRILKVENDFILHTVHGDGPVVPAYLGGDGFKRFLELAASVYDAGERGIVLLEEPESFQHPRYLKELVLVLRDAVASGTQVILSTHSLELIDLLLEEAPASVAPSVHRLRLVDGVLSATTVSAEAARLARSELLEDLRA